jgi:hypothetical protein
MMPSWGHLKLHTDRLCMSALVPQHFTVCNTLGPECRLNARSLVLLYLLHHPLGYRPRERRLWQGECLRPTPRGPGEKRRRVATCRDGRQMAGATTDISRCRWKSSTVRCEFAARPRARRREIVGRTTVHPNHRPNYTVWARAEARGGGAPSAPCRIPSPPPLFFS